MASIPEERLQCEITEEAAGNGKPTMVVKCRGRLVAGNTEPLRAAVQPLIARGGRVVIDCSALQYVDSMGLGALVALKVSSLHAGSGIVEFAELSPRIKELLRITKLTEYLAQPDTINYGG